MPIPAPSPTVTPLDEERLLPEDEVIVSKTDLQGRITYANGTFRRISGYTRAELLGTPHNLIRHPDMPRCVFQFLWDELRAEREVFAFVKNLAKDGAYYWVLAHVTPSYDEHGKVVGYHSNRRTPARSALKVIEPIYATLCEVERGQVDLRSAVRVSMQALVDTLRKAGVSYGEFVFSLIPEENEEGVHAARNQ
ncbi:MAG: PAS domain-containing protein [Planctomycetes bacterium]|nr:PAS domain-containing protein [Planctomycetota bacterium]